MNVDSWNRIGINSSLLYLARIGSAGVAAAGSDNAQAKRLRELQDGLKRLNNALPSISASAKQVKANRIGLLKQRLEALKAVLRFASPEQVKAIAQEVRAIARELASVAKSVGTDSGVAPTGPAAIGTTSAGAQSTPAVPNDAGVTTPDMATAVQATTGPGDGGEAAAAAPQQDGAQPGKSVEGESVGQRRAQGDDGAGLQALLKDAEKVLKEVISLLKAKVAMAGKAAKHDLDAAEKSLAEMAGALAQTGSLDLYTSQGELTSGAAAETAIRSVRA